MPLTLFDMGFFEPSVMEATRYNFGVIAPIMKFGTGMKLVLHKSDKSL